MKTELVKKVVRPTITYSSETWTLTEMQKLRIHAMVMRQNLQIKSFNEKIIEGQLIWFGQVCKMPNDRLIRRVFEIPECREKIKKEDLGPNGSIKLEKKQRKTNGMQCEGKRNQMQYRKQWREKIKKPDPQPYI
ncbi:hypothetical protein FQA39_LY04590 [Lamprigera yunnana]|nr:hypothetical protein FQA39_LY04590 [Lamprigera yunnana]